jgi:topoisomerase-4 subunit A
MKIRAEQDELAQERQWLEKTLGSRQRMKTLIRKEIQADAEQFGDDRRSPIVVRAAAEALDATDLAPSEPVTVILSEKGWARAAKGHEIDPTSVSYKAGDGYLDATRLRSNQSAIFIDTTGRCYSVQAHTLPSARSQGEPLTGRLSPLSGALFTAVLGGEPNQWYLVASDAGYGFVVQLKELFSKNKAGKALLRLPRGAKVLHPVRVQHLETDRVVAISNEGRMLVFAVSDLPALARGKGNKIIGIPGKRVEFREEFVVAIACVPEGGKLLVYSGKRHLALKASDLDHYQGERGRRGNKLPRGFQKVDRVEVE